MFKLVFREKVVRLLSFIVRVSCVFFFFNISSVRSKFCRFARSNSEKMEKWDQIVCEFVNCDNDKLAFQWIEYFAHFFFFPPMLVLFAIDSSKSPNCLYFVMREFSAIWSLEIHRLCVVSRNDGGRWRATSIVKRLTNKNA